MRSLTDDDGIEAWRPVVGFEDSYEVSDLGRVRGLSRVVVTRRGVARRVPGKVLSPKLNTSGYPCVTIHGGVLRPPKVERVHRLVAFAFLGPPPTSAHEVAHGDGDRLNARLANLRWATRAENIADTILHGTHNRGENNYASKISADDAAEVRRMAASGVGTGEIGARFGLSRQAARDIVARRTWRSVA